ncbi:hypothetical protein [Methanogenium cariaci]|uniref:hypothetical protein n=1 Tax=Methanogenium cariaci TaxID=2197 RepID=UPI0012F700CF|nr:hypothetical protein [Methanogenium cariaci]
MPSDYFEMMLRSLNLTAEEREMIVEKRKEQCICDICRRLRPAGGGGGRKRRICLLYAGGDESLY